MKKNNKYEYLLMRVSYLTKYLYKFSNDQYSFQLIVHSFPNFQNIHSMIYKAAPAWSLKGKSKEHKEPPTPSPVAYNPTTKIALNKSPSWKIGKQIRGKDFCEKSPSPTSYNPSRPQKINKMGIIGHEERAKQNISPIPGPGSYTVESIKKSPSISFAKKYTIIDKNKEFPGPGKYNSTNKRDKRGIVIGKQSRFTVQNSEILTHPGPGNYEWKRPSSATIGFTKASRMSHQNFKNYELIGPGKYDIKGDFDKNATFSAGFSLGQKPKIAVPDNTPGPADYSPTHKDLPKSPSITLSSKYRDNTIERSPSPNQYDPNFKNIIIKTENYSMSKAERLPLYGNNNIPGPGSYLKADYTSTGAQISLGISRKVQEREDFPGPGAYSPKPESVLKRPATAKIGKSQRFYKINTEGSSQSFYESKVEFKSPKYSFSRSKKHDTTHKKGPGPGAYKIPSSLCNLSTYVFKH